jgi:hypothetical protein
VFPLLPFCRVKIYFVAVLPILNLCLIKVIPEQSECIAFNGDGYFNDVTSVLTALIWISSFLTVYTSLSTQAQEAMIHLQFA